jgi:transposase InsO family protein
VYSRFVDVEALKTKTGDVVLKAFQKIVGRMGVCKNLNCDEGSEFVYKPFVKYCEDNDITVWMSDPEQENKNAVIERWHRTLRGLILKYVLIKSKSYIDVLPMIIKNYNGTEHRTIHNKPIDVWEGRVRPEQDVAKIEMKFKVGDRVRHVVKKATFDKASSTTNYTLKVYVITKIDGNSIYIDDLKKPFRDFELVKAVEDANVANVKKAEEYNKKVVEDKRQDLIKRRLRREGMDSDLK